MTGVLIKRKDWNTRTPEACIHRGTSVPVSAYVVNRQQEGGHVQAKKEASEEINLTLNF